MMGFLSTTKPISSIDQCLCCYSCCNAFFFLRPRIIPSSTPPPPPPYPISMLNSSSTRTSLVVCHSSKESSALVMSHLHNATTKLNIAGRRMRRRRRSLLVFCNTNGGNSNEDENDGGPGREAEEEIKEEAEVVSPENKAIINACLVGLFTGIGVVLFNIAVDEIRHVFWDGIPDRGASWLREEPIGVKWGHVILIPACGGLLVSMLKLFQTAIEEPKNWNLSSNVKATLDPIFKAVAACITLGTGNSLGPEGPSVEIGASIAKGVGTLFDNSSLGKLSLKAAGSAAGIASELPLYLLLGTVCGLVSLTLSQCTTFMRVAVDNIEKITGVPNTIFPIFGGFTVGLMALAYPEILYWGFENVDLLLESRPLVEVLSVNLLLQIVAVKILATSLCRASGLVGGYYAPSLFIGAATGMAYGKVVSFVFSQSNPIFHLPFLEVASPQAYGLVGMAATLAGVCQVPLTAVLLLFELTQDYRIVLPLLGAVGLSSWITSGQTRRKGVVGTKKVNNENAFLNQQPEISSSSSPLVSSANSVVEKASDESNLGELGRLLYLGGPNDNTNGITHRILVAQAMRTRYATVMMSTSVAEAVSLMLAEKQSCAAIVDDKDLLIGLLTLANIQQFTELSKAKTKSPKELTVSEVCAPEGEECQIPLSVTPNMSLLSAQTLMYRHRMSQVPVVQDQGHPVGLLDNECISLICRGLAIGERLQQFPTLERLKN
ncbi:chloride channel protein CLC-e isoform X2 [Coffea arabica]|uniref:Chloride channel protein CLC-e isoform X2 n=1 Tax=Coffea arabica TaxID=13443 RepID=A0A6P6WX20_COFAR|nr:chloride channel protein CLC-e isoform X2 [Coffea arabica]